jgi:hypothetical protein
MATIEAEDEEWEAELAAGMIKIGRRFGIELEVDYDLHNSGNWTYLPDGGKLWLLGIECPQALSINLIFDQYRLPAGATLYIYSADKSDKIGGFTDYNNQADNLFATDIVLSDKIVIEYYQPANTTFDGELRLATVVHGYRGSSAYPRGFGNSVSCQRNTICPEGDDWRDQIRSVFSLYSGGTEFCSGSIVNNTTNDGTPYALTANHCYEYRPNPGIWVFRFFWESPTCTPSTNFTGYKTMSGAQLKMRTLTTPGQTDCCLVELNQPFPNDYNIYFSGWSRATTVPPSATCIHHPALDIKKISLTSNIVTGTVDGITGWRANWPTGTCTEGGSSGSPLFDNNNRIIGQEYGGPACNNIHCTTGGRYDVYGRIYQSWDNGATSNSLKYYLDPLGLNPETLDGYDPNATPSTVDAELLTVVVPEATYSAIQTITPKVTVKNNGTAPITSATLAYTIDGGSPVSKTWTGTLAVNATTDITFDAITLTEGAHVFTATVTVANDSDPDNNSQTKNYEVILPECLPVQNLTAEQNEAAITITWEAPENTDLTGYAVYVNETLITTAIVETSCTFTKTEGIDLYVICVIALYNYEWCEESPSECVEIIPVSVKELQDNPVKIYPNPTHSHIFVEGEHIKTIEIYNLQGQLLHLQTGDTRKIDVSAFTAGNYLITVSIENGQKVTKQITVKP